LKTVQAMTTFRNSLADPWEPVADPLWSADPSLKTAALNPLRALNYRIKNARDIAYE